MLVDAGPPSTAATATNTNTNTNITTTQRSMFPPEDPSASGTSGAVAQEESQPTPLDPHDIPPAASTLGQEPQNQITSPEEDIPIDSAYEGDETDSAYDAGSTYTDTTSLRSDITKYRYENNRRYHAYKDGEYWGPNDEKQNNQLDIAHHMYLLMMGGKLHLAPIENPHNVLDVGTGTGIWAMDFADQYPSSQVLGFDLSPIQPEWLPPNVRFEINDACAADWAYKKNSFDFIHVRTMYGSVADWPAFYQQALESVAHRHSYYYLTPAVPTLYLRSTST